MTQDSNILAHWGPPGTRKFYHFGTPGTPQDPYRRDPPGPARVGAGGGGGGMGTDGHSAPQDPCGEGGCVNIRIFVYLQLQGPGSRLGAPNGAFKIGPKAYH